ncbi:UNVERIFIED_ORG: hypothetical protein EDC92_11921 [Dietzia maris]|uniref:DUF6262 family protein n=1 Tax=Dietzia maris TaxID=37915 RepID=UPI0010501EE7
MTKKRTPAEVLHDARRAESSRKRLAVFQAVDKMLADGTVVSYAAVAREANVSSWLVRADGVRDYVAAARDRQADEVKSRKPDVRDATASSLRVDLELARQDNRALRAEVDRMKKALQAGLGRRLEYEAASTLRDRVDELSASNARLQEENGIFAARVIELERQLESTDDELTAARSSLRRMIRQFSE